MKKVYVIGVQPDPEGPTFGRIMRAADFQKSQDYAHAHVIQVTKDLLVAGAAVTQVAGFAAAVDGGLNVTVQPGTAVDPDGVSYDLDAEATVAVGAADPALPRIDLIYATLAIDSLVDTEFRPFRRLRTPAEEEAGTEEYPQIPYNVPTEMHSLVTLAVKAGAPNAVPVAPAAGGGEVPLWQVHVAAGQTVLAGGDLTDVRLLMRSLYQALVDILALQTQVGNLSETIDDRVAALVLDSPSVTKLYDDVANSLQLFVTNEALDDRVAALIGDTTSIVKAYDDPGNVLTFVLHSTYKTLLDNATSAATASALMKRDASGDVQTRDFKPTRQILFSDNSIRNQAKHNEEPIPMFALAAPFTTNVGPYPGTMSIVNGPEGLPFFVNLKAEDFVNVPLLFEAVLQYDNTLNINHALQAQLYNQTDASVLGSCTAGWLSGGAILETPVLARSQIFFLTGSGRKRLIVRLGAQLNGENSARIWRARIIAYPAYSDCGNFTQAACTL